jgi:hypothetical protein
MNDLSIGCLVFIVSIALIPQAVWLWWKNSLLRKKSIQSALISLEQQYAEDIKLGKAVVVSDVINKIYWLKIFWFVFSLLVMVLFCSQFYVSSLDRCQLYGGVVGFYLLNILYIFVLLFNFLSRYIRDYFVWYKSKKDGYFPSRKILEMKPFVAYKITPEIAKKQTRSLWEHGYYMVVLVALMSLVLYVSDPFQGTKSWHEANVLMQKQCLAKQRTNL